MLSKRGKGLTSKGKAMNDTLRAQQLFSEAYPDIRYESVKELYTAAYRFFSKHLTKQLTYRRLRSLREGTARRVDGEEMDVLRLAVIEESRVEQRQLRARLAALDAKLASFDAATAEASMAASGGRAS